jgi:KUP system potassium uptake protein
VVLTLTFRSADKLGDIYGVAVTGTFILNTLLFVAVARLLWGTPKRRILPVAALFLIVETTFFSANIAKVEHGAWLPLVIALAISLVMINWRRARSSSPATGSPKRDRSTTSLTTCPSRSPRSFGCPVSRSS